MSATCNLFSNSSAKYIHVWCSPEEGHAGKALVRQQEWGRGMTEAALVTSGGEKTWVGGAERDSPGNSCVFLEGLGQAGAG